MQSRCIPPSVYMGIVCDMSIIVWGFGMFSSPWWFCLTISPLMILTLLSSKWSGVAIAVRELQMDTAGATFADLSVG